MTVEEMQTGAIPVYLVVDDHEGFRSELCRRLRRECRGQIVDCSNGEEAIAAYERFRPHWVIMDIEMPEMDGLSATRVIRARFPEARILVLTQHDSQELRAAATECGVSAFVAKENLTQVSQIINRSTGPSSSPPRSASEEPTQA